MVVVVIEAAGDGVCVHMCVARGAQVVDCSSSSSGVGTDAALLGRGLALTFCYSTSATAVTNLILNSDMRLPCLILTCFFLTGGGAVVSVWSFQSVSCY